MIVKFNNREFRVRWTYDKIQIGTHCTINEVRENKEYSVSAGWANLHNGDHFNRDIGRKISLKRAISKFILNKSFIYTLKDPQQLYQFKRTIWETYRTMTKIPRW